MYKTLHGLVLREVKYKESSKILTILTEEEGKITAEARGALRKGSKCSAGEKKIFSFTLDESSDERFCTACEEYTLAQLDRGFGTLDYWHSLQNR